MRLIFAAGDAGGARALAPVAHFAATSGNQTWVVQHGAIAQDYADYDVAWTWIRPDKPQRLLSEFDVEMVVFASSVTDTMALELALSAQARGLSTAHVLDNWSNYATRLIHPNGQRLSPDVYAVMDDLAYQSALGEGVDPVCLVITGSPALAHVTAQVPNPTGGIIFASEPVSLDQGRDPTKPSFRGYTEDQILELLLGVLQPWGGQITLQVFPHPREDPVGLEQVIRTHGGDVPCTVLTVNEKPAALANARAMIGMSSILLYYSWLAGLPTLSFQPDLRLPHLCYLEGRSGLLTVDDADQLGAAVVQLLDSPVPNHTYQAGHERARHQGAPYRVLTALSNCLRRRTN